MRNVKKERREKKIIFSETIDSAINGYALGISFTGIGVFLLLSPKYFFAPVVSYILGAIICVFGVVGIAIELSKSSHIKGIDNITTGAVLFCIWLTTYLKVSLIWVNIVTFLLLVFGVYACCLGLIQCFYSIFRGAKSTENEKKKLKKSTMISQTVLLLTQLCGMIVAIINLVKILGTV